MKKTRIICLICAVMMLLGSFNAFAINNDTVYEGNNDITLDGQKTHTDPDGNTVNNMTVTPVNGNFGKMVSDKVYDYSGFSNTNGGASDYISMWYSNFGQDYVINTQVCITEHTTLLDYQLGFFYESGNKDVYLNGNLFRINSSGSMYIYDNNWIAEEQRTKEIAALEKNRWYNIDVVLTIGTSYATVYLDGEPTVINFAPNAQSGTEEAPVMYGLRHFRISTGKGYSGTGTSASDIPCRVYMDNVSSINTSEYNADDDKKASLTSAKYAISEDNVITLDTIDASADEILSNVTADSSRIRIYTNSSMSTLATGDMGIGEDAVLVVAKTVNGHETSYNYYTFSFPGAESNMFSGTQNIALTEGGTASAGMGSDKYPASEGYTHALQYPVNGGSGKKASDGVYYWGGKTCGSGGHWYMNINNSKEPTPAHIYEITFKLGKDATGFYYGPAPFVKDETGANTTDFTNVYPFFFSLTDGAVVYASTSGSVTPYSTDGTNHVFAKDSRGVKFGDIEPDKWYTFTMITYADGTDDFDVYFNGEKFSLNFNFAPGPMRHVRMYAAGASNQQIYFDNLKSYGVSSAEARAYTCRDTKAEVEFIGYEVQNNVIEDILYGTTVADLKGSMVTDANIRVYADNTCKTLMADYEEVTERTTVVVATTNGTAYERALSYYSVALAKDYDELTAATRITDLKVNEAEDKYYVTFDAKNLSQTASETDITVALALYDDEDTLVDIAFGEASVSSGTSISVTAADDISIAKDIENGTVRAFVWWGDTQKPFAKQAELKVIKAE